METLALPSINWLAVLPLGLTSLLGLVLLALGLVVDDDESLGWVMLVGLVVTAIATACLAAGEKASTFNGTFALDGYAIFFDMLFLFAGIVVVLMSMTYLEGTGIPAGDYYGLLSFAIAGMVVMASATDLIVIFLGLEVMSISVYVLAGAWRTQLRSNEAAMKYFLLGAFATGFLLYGIALIYGATGFFRLDQIAAVIPATPNHTMLMTGVGMLIVAFGFKVAAVPFHMWTPDVYEGAPTTVTALMAVAVKAAAFAAFVRIFLHGFGGLHADWSVVLWGMAALTMTVGNLLALAQTSVKRMLAYSSIAHAGYILVALVASGAAGGIAALFYLLVYSFMTLGAFGVVAAIGTAGEPNETLDDYAGLGFRRPLLGVTMTIFMLSLTGIPPLAGFAGKLYIFTTAIREGYYVLAVIGVLNSAISAAYYVRVLIAMYLTPGAEESGRVARQPYLLTSIVLSAVMTVIVGVFPAVWMELARMGFLSL
jgi:NADH-quinone oxidoreductase subunit N